MLDLMGILAGSLINFALSDAELTFWSQFPSLENEDNKRTYFMGLFANEMK